SFNFIFVPLTSPHVDPFGSKILVVFPFVSQCIVEIFNIPEPDGEVLESGLILCVTGNRGNQKNEKKERDEILHRISVNIRNPESFICGARMPRKHKTIKISLRRGAAKTQNHKR